MAVKLLAVFLIALGCFAQTQVDFPTQVQRKPALDVREFNFSRPSGLFVSGNLSVAGAVTITFTPCPKGVNGTDTNHYYYVSGGVGTPEAFLGTGGTCTSGAASGTIIGTTINTHTGAWTIQSASSGHRECFIMAGSGGACSTPAGTWNFYAPIYNDQNVTWFGTGVTTNLQQQFAGDGIIIGPSTLPTGFITIHDLSATYGVGGYATTGSLWTFRNVADGDVRNISSSLGYYGFKFNNSVRVKYSGLYSNANSRAYYLTTSSGQVTAGAYTNLYGFVQNSGTLMHIEGTIGGIQVSQFLLEATGSSTGTIGFLFNTGVTSLFNDIQISNGFIDSTASGALVVPYSASPAQTPGGAIDFSNVKFTTNSGSSAPVITLNAPIAGVQFNGCRFVSGGTGDVIVFSGAKNSVIGGSTLDVSNAASRPLVFQAGTGGEVNSNILISGSSFGFNEGVAPTNAVATDAAAHTGIWFDGNKFNGAVGWSATGTNNRFYMNQGVTNSTITIQPPAGGNQVNVGLDFINSLKNGTPGLTMWAVAQDGTNKGVFRLSDGSGVNGWDGNGAQTYGTASDGQMRSNFFTAANPATLPTNNQGTLGGGFVQGKFGTNFMWVMTADGSHNGYMALYDGTSAGGLDGGGAKIVCQASAITCQVGGTVGSANQVNIGRDYVNSLKNGTAGLTIFALAQDGANNGVFRLSDSSGAAGFDGNGAHIYGTASDGQLRADILKAGTTLDSTGAVIKAPSGSSGLTGTLTVRNAAGSGTCTMTLSGGLITASTC